MRSRKILQVISLILIAYATLTGCASRNSTVVPNEAALATNQARSVESAPYIIQPGDQLDIKFFYNPELNETLTVRPDGKISMQLVDEVQAAGLKPSDLDEVLTKEYSQELLKPVITVIVREFGGQRIFVGGEVNNQGLITVSSNMTPLQAVFDAGGFKETASPKDAIIIRKGPDNKPVPIAINLEDAMHGKTDSVDFLLKPDDIVYVPKSAIAKANTFVNQYIENLLLYRGISLGFGYDLNPDNRYGY